MEKSLTALLIIIYLNVNSQTIPKGLNKVGSQKLYVETRFDIVCTDKNNVIFYSKPNGEIFVKDSLETIKRLLEIIADKQKEIKILKAKKP